MSTQTIYSPAEERMNWLTHGLAFLLCLYGTYPLTQAIPKESNMVVWLSIAIFLFSLVVLYFSSTLYHYISDVKWKDRFKLADHSAIFIMIAGTYTPFLLLAPPVSYSLWILVGMWLIVLVGITMKVYFVKRFRVFFTILYLIMGWTALAMIKPLYEVLSADQFLYLILGGVSFTIGVVFYLWRKIPYHHAIWHLFVMGGSGFHFYSIYLLITKQ